VISDFFNNVPKFTQLDGVIEERNFYPAPADWLIVIADIRSSTKAVSEGRYKDVNLIGGAVICAVQNATGHRDWPFVFGGDGATVLIEPAAKASVEAALVRTRSLAKDDFDLDLRIGFVPVSDVRKLGTDVLVARYEVSPGNSMAQFGGGGVELADELIKSDTSSQQYSVADYSLEGLPDLTGLSCRWEPLNTQKGMILCLLIKPQGPDFQHKQVVLSRFLSKLSTLLGDDLSQASPITKKGLRLSWPPKGLVAEAKATRAGRFYVLHLVQLYIKSFIQWILERYKLRFAGYDAPVYKEEMRTNSDYCKFDDVLRMVLDCTVDQVAQVRSLLDQMHKAGDIDFGCYETERALMTCLLFDLKSSQHLHFIDGDDGGLYSASIGLKQQLSSR
jgi:hypothetical protein